MELRQFRYLVAVVEEGGFTRAAERLHVAQPGVSAQIRRLERELGQDLLDRSARTVRLTAAGEAVLPHARAALAAVDGARLAVDELAGLVRGRVAVGMVTSMPARSLPDLLAGFHRDHPNVEITLVEGESARLAADLRAGRLDLAFIGPAEPWAQGLRLHVIVDEAFVGIVAPDDPLAARRSITVDELREATLICLPRGTGLRGTVEAACAEAGFRPRVALEASDPAVLAELARSGLGLAIVPESLGAARGPGVLELGLRGRLALAWRAEGPAGPAARALIARAREIFPVVSGR